MYIEWDWHVTRTSQVGMATFIETVSEEECPLQQGSVHLTLIGERGVYKNKRFASDILLQK